MVSTGNARDVGFGLGTASRKYEDKRRLIATKIDPNSHPTVPEDAREEIVDGLRADNEGLRLRAMSGRSYRTAALAIIAKGRELV